MSVRVRPPVPIYKGSIMSSVQQLADRLKEILGNPELIKRLAEQDAKDGSVTADLDKLNELTEQLAKTYEK